MNKVADTPAVAEARATLQATNKVLGDLQRRYRPAAEKVEAIAAHNAAKRVWHGARRDFYAEFGQSVA